MPVSSGSVLSLDPDPRPMPSRQDREIVERLLGRTPQGPYEVVVRDGENSPVVILNGPFLDDGRPMPTRYWLVGRELSRQVARVESSGGVRDAEAAVDAVSLADAHNRYAVQREADIPADHTGPRPSGGIGGTRRGVKCLHAHVAHYLATGDDPVGEWTLAQIAGPTEESE